MLQYLQDHGVTYREAGQVKDPLLIFKEHGCNYVRLRLFVNPDGTKGQVNTLSYTLALAKRAKLAGFHLLLDFHYSDKWADPGHQFIPGQWKDLPPSQLANRVRTYTRGTLAAFRQQGCSPDMVALGNEISNGMLWPIGGPLSVKTNWEPFAGFLKAALQGMKEDDPDGKIKVMIHVNRGSEEAMCRWFYDNLQKQGVDFDFIGLSFYPSGQDDFGNLRANLDFLARTYQKNIIVVETSYAMNGAEQGRLPFPRSPEGQKSFLEELFRTVAATPEGRGAGVFYWAPEWIADRWRDPAGRANHHGDRALFDPSGNLLPALQAFQFAPP